MAERRWILLAATVAGIAAAAGLGTWQLDRAAQKTALQAAIEARASLPPLTTRDLPPASEPADPSLLHRHAMLEGRWDADPRHTLYLDNRPMDGRVGFIVVTPFVLANRPEALLVQRGWLPRDATDRERLPPLHTPTGDVRIEGRLASTPSRAFELGTPVKTGPIRQNVDLSSLQADTGLPLLPLVLLQSDGPSQPDKAGTAGPGVPADGAASAPGTLTRAPGGAGAAGAAPQLLRHWPAPAVDVHKHYGYAFQWFALGALILGLYVWFQVLAPLRRDRRRGRTPDTDAP